MIYVSPAKQQRWKKKIATDNYLCVSKAGVAEASSGGINGVSWPSVSDWYTAQQLFPYRVHIIIEQHINTNIYKW